MSQIPSYKPHILPQTNPKYSLRQTPNIPSDKPQIHHHTNPTYTLTQTPHTTSYIYLSRNLNIFINVCLFAYVPARLRVPAFVCVGFLMYLCLGVYFTLVNKAMTHKDDS